MKLTFTGVVPMQRRLQAIARRFPDEVRKALLADVELDATESKRRCPVDTGALQSTIHVEDRSGGLTIRAALVCGGPAAPYAVYVHEDLEAVHPTGEAKFIESVLRESAPFRLERVARRIDMRAIASKAG